MTNNFDEEYLTMDVSESPISEWSKEDEYSNWFIQFDNIREENDEGFEVIDSAEVENAQGNGEGGDDDDDD